MLLLTVNENWDEIWSDLSEGMGENPARRMRQDAIINRIQSGNTLDFGAGDGELVLRLIDLGFDCIGLEKSAEGVARANTMSKSLGLGQILFSLDSEEAKTATFDNLILSEVLEHIEKPYELLQLLTKYLKPNGLLIVTVPSGPISYFDRFIGHHRHYTSESLAKELVESNFEVVEIKQIGFPIVNIVRIWCLLRGKKIVLDLANPTKFFDSATGRAITKFFSIIGQVNSPFGWQLIAVVKMK